jgi:hypothetical protein
MQSENIMIADKHKVEKEQNAQLRNQVAQLLHTEQDQKMIMQQKDSTIQTLQVCFIFCFSFLLLGLRALYIYWF